MRHPEARATGLVKGPRQLNQEEAGVGDGFSLLLSEGMVVVYANSLKPSPIASLPPKSSSPELVGWLKLPGAAISIDSGRGKYYVQFC